LYFIALDLSDNMMLKVMFNERGIDDNRITDIWNKFFDNCESDKMTDLIIYTYPGKLSDSFLL